MSNFTFINIFPFDDKVFVTYEAASANGESFRNVEILTVHQEKITGVDVYFGWSIPHKAQENSFIE